MAPSHSDERPDERRPGRCRARRAASHRPGRARSTAGGRRRRADAGSKPVRGRSGRRRRAPGRSGIDPIRAQRRRPGASDGVAPGPSEDDHRPGHRHGETPTVTIGRSSMFRRLDRRRRPAANGSIAEDREDASDGLRRVRPGGDERQHEQGDRRRRRRAGVARAPKRRCRSAPSGATTPRRSGSRSRAGSPGGSGRTAWRRDRRRSGSIRCRPSTSGARPGRPARAIAPRGSDRPRSTRPSMTRTAGSRVRSEGWSAAHPVDPGQVRQRSAPEAR